MANLTMLTLDDPVDQSLFTINGNFTALNDELAAKASQNHEHDASAIVSGVVSPARLGSGSASSAVFLRGDGQWTNWLDGFAGFGVSSPQHPVHVNSSEAWKGFRADRSGAPFFAAYSDAAGHGEMVLSTAGGQNNVVLRASGVSVLNGGNVGIGTASPDRLVHVYSEDSANNVFRFEVNPSTGGSVSARIQVAAYNVSGFYTGGVFTGHAARGTKASPAALQSGDRMAVFGGLGYAGDIERTGALFTMLASGNWSPTSTPTDVQLLMNGPNEISSPVKFRWEGTGAFVIASTAQTPSAPVAGGEAKIYVTGGKLVIQYNDAGTVRYKYLDLAGTSTTWQHSTAAP